MGIDVGLQGMITGREVRFSLTQKRAKAYNVPKHLNLCTESLILEKRVIPAPYRVRDKLQRESRKALDSGSSPE